ncbi:MAG: hypothetical protein AAF501_16025 [Pseudomonadota bacterium]
MRPLAWRLERAGIHVVRLGYASTQQTIAQSVEEVGAHLVQLAGASGGLRLVGHSLGGLIAALLLRRRKDLPISSVVQIGSPNLGSSLANRIGGVWPVRRFCGPAVTELTAHDSRQITDPRIAAIAGTGGFGLAPLARPNDGAVTVRSAWAGAGHRAAVPVLHTLMPASSRVAALVIAFLTHGHFGKANT